MNLPVLSTTNVAIDEFVKFWSSFYNYPMEDYYVPIIGKKKFSADDINKLFIWKNGSKLSQKKEAVLSNIKAKLDVINNLKDSFLLDSFLKDFSFVNGAIWKIYLLHIIKPNDFPIFDQHVYRAFIFLKQNRRNEIPNSNKQKEQIYFAEYAPFFNALCKKGIPWKKLDEALWAYGKFLKTEYGRKA